MFQQWIIFAIVLLVLALDFAASQRIGEGTTADFKCWNNPTLVRGLFCRPFEKFPLEDFGCKNVTFNEATMPDISEIKTLDKNTTLTLINPRHRELIRKLCDIFDGQKTFEGLIKVAVYIRDQVNPQLFHHALKNALWTRREAKKVKVPNMLLTQPVYFVDKDLLESIIEHGLEGNKSHSCEAKLEKDKDDKEQLLSYFREDFGLNSHHFNWHSDYIVSVYQRSPQKNRNGELFYYMHSQLLARYNFERLSNGLNITQALYMKKQVIPEGYSHKLASFTSRAPSTELKDSGLSEVNTWEQNIRDAIMTNSIRYADKTVIKPTEEDFTDLLDHMIEPTLASPNLQYYGSLHGQGHDVLAALHKTGESGDGVMGNTMVAVRDPVFWRWHTTINDLFNLHKERLPPYNSTQLGFDGVRIKSVKIKTKHDSADENEFVTFMERSKLNITDGIKSDQPGSFLVCYEHLQHHPFAYTIEVESNKEVMGTVRIFMAPTYDAEGKVFDFNKQRSLFIEMDTFPYLLRKGTTTIKRNSVQSSVAVPTERSFNRIPVETRQVQQSYKVVITYCGLPDYLLVPRGTAQGLNATLFVMISDWKDGDKVDSIDPFLIDSYAGTSLCGFNNTQAYPWKRPMGFPFDRVHKENNFTQFSSLPNMHVIHTKVRFSGEKM